MKCWRQKNVLIRLIIAGVLVILLVFMIVYIHLLADLHSRHCMTVISHLVSIYEAV